MEVREPRANYFAATRKQTEIGSIPVDWGVAQIGDLIFDMRGGAPLKPSDFTDGGVKVLPKGAVGRTGWLQIRERDLQFCSPTYAAKYIRNQVNRDYAIVVLRDLVPSGPTIGLIVRIHDDETLLLAQGVYGFRAIDRVVPGYLVHLSNTNRYRKLANSIMVGSTQVHITNTAFKKARIPLPPTQEQEAISNVLDDADALIDSLEQLLTKKRQIKQGAMQELLTGKRRLPGFKGNWAEVALDEFVEVRKGELITAASAVPGDVPVIGGGKTSQYTHVRGNRNGPVITVSASGASAGYVSFHEGPIFASDCSTIEARNGYSLRFVYFALLHRQQLIYQAQTGGAQPHVQPRDLAPIVIWMPADEDEQAAIAQVLSEMDAEIATLEYRLTKARALKQAMAQALLTGRIRIPLNLQEPTA